MTEVRPETKLHVDNILHKLSANYQMIRQYLLYLSGEFVVIVCKVSKRLIVYFPDDVCPRLPDPYNGRVHMTGIKSFFSQEISKTLIYFFCISHNKRRPKDTIKISPITIKVFEPV